MVVEEFAVVVSKVESDTVHVCLASPGALDNSRNTNRSIDGSVQEDPSRYIVSTQIDPTEVYDLTVDVHQLECKECDQNATHCS